MHLQAHRIAFFKKEKTYQICVLYGLVSILVRDG